MIFLCLKNKCWKTCISYSPRSSKFSGSMPSQARQILRVAKFGLRLQLLHFPSQRLLWNVLKPLVVFCTTCLGESKLMGYKYKCIKYLDVYQAALMRRRMPKHACLQIVLYIYIYINVFSLHSEFHASLQS